MSEPTTGSRPPAPPSIASQTPATPPPPASLPERPSAEFLRKLAKDRLREMRAAHSDARLYEAQIHVARDHGFRSWRDLIAHLSAGRRGTVRRDGGRVVIDGVEPLRWQGSDCTYLGALANVLRVVGPARDYATLVGDSGIGFRTRFWSADDGTGSCPSNPGGEFWPWDMMAERSVGWESRVVARLQPSMDEAHDMSDLLDEVTASIDAGIPVLGFVKSWDMGIVYGYDGSRLLCRDYFAGDAETWVDIADARGLFMFLEQRHPVPPRLESARAALAEGVGRWTHPPDRHRRGDGADGAYYYGRDAYDRWTALLRRANEGGLTPDQLGALLHVDFWTYTSLHDARQKAALYLRSVAELFPPPAALSLRAAADVYQQLGEITGRVIHEGRLFPAFYQPGALERWTPDVRAEEVVLLEQMRAMDERAVAALRAVVG